MSPKCLLGRRRHLCKGIDDAHLVVYAFEDELPVSNLGANKFRRLRGRLHRYAAPLVSPLKVIERPRAGATRTPSE